MGEDFGFLGHPLDPDGFEGVEGDEPRGDGGGEGLAEEGAEGLVFPPLDVAGGPVVDEDEPKDVVFGGFDGDSFGEVGSFADVVAEFEFEVELEGGAEGGEFGVGGFSLAFGPGDGVVGGDDAAGAAVVADGEVAVVGEEGWLVGAEHSADVAGVVDAAVEVDERGGGDGDEEVEFGDGEEGFVAKFFVVAEVGGLCVEEVGDPFSEVGEALGVEAEEGVEPAEVFFIEEVGFHEEGEVEGVVADGGDEAFAPVFVVGEGEGDVLDGEGGVVGNGEP